MKAHGTHQGDDGLTLKGKARESELLLHGAITVKWRAFEVRDSDLSKSAKSGGRESSDEAGASVRISASFETARVEGFVVELRQYTFATRV